MKTIYKIIAMVAATAALVCCGEVEESSNTCVNYWVSFENKTQHNIDVTLVAGSNPLSDPSVYTRHYELGAGGHFQDGFGTVRYESGETLSEKLNDLIIPESAYIVYDDKYAVSFERNSEDNNHLCKLDDYQMIVIHEYATAYHYDFTEADYEYAKEFGEEVSAEDDMSNQKGGNYERIV